MKVNFVQATEAELPIIVKIYNQNIASKMVTADLEPVTIIERQKWFKEHNAERPLWLILADGQPAGWLSLESFYGRAAYHATVEISIYIDHQFQHQGLGTKSLQFVTQQTLKLGIHTILAYVFSSNEASQRLFKAAGYQVYGHLPQVADMNGKLNDLDILGKKF